MNLGACLYVGTTPENAVWYRAIQPAHWPTALSIAHTRGHPSRFSPATPSKPAFPVLYLAEDHHVALLEVGALWGSGRPGSVYIPNPRQAWTLLNVRVILQGVADLTDPAEQQRLQTSAQELTGDWQGYLDRNSLTPVPKPTGLAPTQELGRALHGVPGLEGFRTVSARLPTHRNLVIFPDKLEPGSSVVFSNPATGTDLRIP
jgi:RES domain-containing protein